MNALRASVDAFLNLSAGSAGRLDAAKDIPHFEHDTELSWICVPHLEQNIVILLHEVLNIHGRLGCDTNCWLQFHASGGYFEISSFQLPLSFTSFAFSVSVDPFP